MHTQLSREEREKIAICYQQGKSYSEIGKLLGRSHTTIIREISRNGVENRGKLKIKYSCFDAEEKAKKRKIQTNQKRKKLRVNHRLHKLVYEKLSDESKIRSPAAISGRLKLERGINISIPTIYNYIHKHKPEREKYLRYKQW